MHKSLLVTPSVQLSNLKLWRTQSKHLPVARAEKRIQDYLHLALAVEFPSCVIRREQSQATGRLDLEIEEPVTGQAGLVVRHALLELKVLRSYRGRGTSVSEKNGDAIADGVRQAGAYRKERGTRTSALCCFDMRKSKDGEQCFLHVVGLARYWKVTLKLWPLFASSKAYREHLKGVTGEIT